jgi:hypothetical protein
MGNIPRMFWLAVAMLVLTAGLAGFELCRGNWLPASINIAVVAIWIFNLRVCVRRIIDETEARRRPCEVCGSNYLVCGHHIKSRGSGGPDTAENIVSLCVPCHHDVHMALISRDELRAIVARR